MAWNDMTWGEWILANPAKKVTTKPEDTLYKSNDYLDAIREADLVESTDNLACRVIQFEDDYYVISVGSYPANHPYLTD